VESGAATLAQVCAFLQGGAANFQSLDDPGLGKVGERHEQAGRAGRSGRQCHGEDAADRAEVALEADLTGDHGVAQGALRKLAAGNEKAQCDRQVEGRPVLAYVGRREVDGDAAKRKHEAGVGQGGTDALSPFLHRPVRQSDRGERGQAVADVHLDIDRIRVDAQDGGRTDACEHGARGQRPGPE